MQQGCTHRYHRCHSLFKRGATCRPASTRKIDTWTKQYIVLLMREMQGMRIGMTPRQTIQLVRGDPYVHSHIPYLSHQQVATFDCHLGHEPEAFLVEPQLRWFRARQALGRRAPQQHGPSAGLVLREFGEPFSLQMTHVLYCFPF